MDNAIRDLALIYTEKLALKARKYLVDKLWNNPSDLPKDVIKFKDLFKSALVLIKTNECTVEEKQMFLESIFRSELRILLHQIVEIKRLDIQKAEDVCQEILINLFKQIIPDFGSIEKSYRKDKKETSFFNDDYKSFVFYCLKTIKNYGSNQFKAKIHFKIEEFK
ncbi:MAG: hypothetical protein OEV44_03810 [Spirochaetota bacterium]|nr:hypothetical protein [Spirochaetota bacterium]